MPKQPKSESNTAIVEVELFDVNQFVQDEESRRLAAEAEDRQSALAAYLRLIVRDQLNKPEGLELLDAAETLGISPQGVIDDQRLIAKVRRLQELQEVFDERQAARVEARENWRAFLERAQLEATKFDLLLTHAQREYGQSFDAGNELRGIAQRRPELFENTNPPRLKSIE